MNIDAATGRQVQHRLGNDLAVGGNHNEVRPPAAEMFQRLGGANLWRLKDRHGVGAGAVLDGRGVQVQPSSGGFVRLTHHPDHCVLALKQGLKRRHGKLRRPHKDQPQRPRKGGEGKRAGHLGQIPR